MESFLMDMGRDAIGLALHLEQYLEGVSVALAGMTGLGPAVCYDGMLAGAGAGIAALLAWLDPSDANHDSPDGLPMSFERAQALGKRPAPVFWAGRWHDHNAQKYHFAISDTTRAGKSLMFSLYLRSVISQIRPNSDRRLVLFDPKCALWPALLANVTDVPVHILLPSDERCSAWNLAKDLNNPGAIMQFWNAFVPDVTGDANPFFARAARELGDGVMSSLNSTHPGRWDLADVVRILESRELIAQVLARTPHTRSKLQFMGEERTWANILVTMQTHLNALRIMAAMWSRANSTFSLVDFVRTEGILVLGRDPRISALLDPMNLLVLTQLFGHLLAQGDSSTRCTHIAVDEFTVAAGEGKPLPAMRDICERGASAGVVIALAYQSYAHVKEIYKDGADAILGMLQNQVFLKAEPSTAEFASKAFGMRRGWLSTCSDTSSRECSTTRSDHWHEYPLVPPEKFLEIPPATEETGITGYSLSAAMRDPHPFVLPGYWIAENLPKRGEDAQQPYLSRPDSHQYLSPFSFADLKRLGLTLGEPEEDAGAALPITPLPSKGSAPDDHTGKLRNLISGRGSKL